MAQWLDRIFGGLGLHPRVRGKRQRYERLATLERSIPACTGETMALSQATPATQVYPRVYGGNVRLKSGLGRSGGLSPRVRGKLQNPN